MAFGFEEAHRSQQYCGSTESADVICKELDIYHFEVKSGGTIRLYDAIEQATNDCAGIRVPVVAHHRDRGEWLVTMRASDWLRLEKIRLDNELELIRVRG